MIYSNLIVNLETTKNIVMHNLYANFVIFLEVCKRFAQDFVNIKGNIPLPGVVPGVVAQSIMSETWA